MQINKLLSTLNKKQVLAVTKPRVPVLMLAGPGTGKTRTLIARIAYQIQHFKIAEEHILALTFSNKASREINKRLEELFNSKLSTIKACYYSQLLPGNT